MPEVKGNNEHEYRPPVMVEVAGLKLGHLHDKTGDSFELSDLYGEGRMYLGGDAFTQVYFRTDSGNIYLLDESGRLTNGRLSESQKRVHSTKLNPDDLEHEKLTVGKPFVYGRGNTTKITEIVPTNTRFYDPEYLKNITHGRKVTIHEDFVKMMPPRTSVSRNNI